MIRVRQYRNLFAQYAEEVTALATIILCSPSNLPVCEIENQVLTPRKAEYEEQIDLEPENS